ncbi:tolloid-like protein 1 [Nematostella vectensis]|uniref:tolloid-like protein 1 n=1 Tax=Nematostella vectensis TaxID=45351 RepID=UPI002076D59A|nr:tolloid-like protein 1 [Nematostella vectensis]
MLAACLMLSLVGASYASWCPNTTYLNDNGGSFSSPRFPDLYPMDLQCVWEITAPESLHVKVSFLSFDVEECGKQACECDAVTFLDVSESGETSVIARYCGHSTPNAVYSRRRTLRVVFSTDEGDSGFGFRAKYEATQRGFVCSSKPLVISNGGTLASPDYDTTYPSLVECKWIIKSPPETRIRLKFLKFSIQNCSNSRAQCTCDHLTLRDGNTSSADVIGRYCGNELPMDLYSSGRYLWLEFSSDENVNGKGKGFIAEFSSRRNGESSCPQDWRFPFRCPLYQGSNESTICCYDNGASCCLDGGNTCSDKWSAERSYCPRPNDAVHLTRCCEIDGQAACCLNGSRELTLTRLLIILATIASCLTNYWRWPPFG